jgi:hypothetical protein
MASAGVSCPALTISWRRVPIVKYSFLTNRQVLSNSVTAAEEPARLTDHWSECVTAKELVGLATFWSRGRGAGRHVYSSWPTL